MKKGRSRLKKPMSLGDVLLTQKTGRFQGDLVSLYRLQKNWDGIVGKDLARHTTPQEIRGKTLVVVSENPAWSHHLSMIKDEILNVVVERTGKEFLNLRFVTGKIPAIQKSKEVSPTSTKPNAIPNSSESLKEILSSVSHKLQTLQKNR